MGTFVGSVDFVGGQECAGEVHDEPMTWARDYLAAAVARERRLAAAGIPGAAAHLAVLTNTETPHAVTPASSAA